MSGNRTPGVCVAMSLNPVLFQNIPQFFIFHRFAFLPVFEQIGSKTRKFAQKLEKLQFFVILSFLVDFGSKYSKNTKNADMAIFYEPG